MRDIHRDASASMETSETLLLSDKCALNLRNSLTDIPKVKELYYASLI